MVRTSNSENNPCLSHNGEFANFCIGSLCTIPAVPGCGSCTDGIMNQDEKMIDCGGTCNPCPECPESPDYQALMAIYNSTGGDSWTNNTGWGEDCDVCKWYGIECDTNSRVINLLLPFNGLKNELPSELGDLNQLRGLLLDLNELTGQLPKEIGKLTELQFFTAFGNQLTGAIPNEIGNLTNLVWLLLNNNLFSDTIPASLGKLTHLNQLLLSSNQLEGHIPEELANLESIRSIYLNDNKLSGCIPTSFSVLCGKDIKLHDNLCLSHNGAFRSFCINNQCQPARVVGCGSCDDGILNQDEEKIDCGGTCTSCSPCSGTFDFEALMVFYEATDGDNWKINTGWGEDCNICDWYGVECDSNLRVTYLLLPLNGLKNEIPTQIGELTNLEGLLLDLNELSGKIPSSIGNLVNLQFFTGSENNFTGPIPESIGQLSQLKWLLLNNNDLSDSIPSSLGNLQNLDQLLLNNNRLSGAIPPELALIKNIRNLYLSDNELSGCIPEQFTELCGRDIKLHNNPCLSHNGDFRSFCTTTECSIPMKAGCGTCDDGIKNQDETDIDCGGSCEQCKACLDTPDYEALMAIYHGTDGPNWENSEGWGDSCNICQWYGVECDSNNVAIGLFLPSNGLKNELPIELGELIHLQYLILDLNELSGTLPHEIGKLSKLQFFTASENNLSGPIPSEIGNLTKLKWLLLNKNQFYDSIPASFGNLVNINQLLLNSNSLSGPIPESLATLPNISSLYLNDNQLSGCIPESFSKLCGKDIKLRNNPCLSHNGEFANFCIGSLCTIPAVPGCGSCTDGILNQDEKMIDCGGTCNPCPECPESPDYQALMAIYNSTGGDSWTNNTGWGEDCDVCKWYGIECDTNSRVINLLLPFNGLKNELPSELGDLNQLRGLLLDLNELTGQLPKEIGKLTELQFFIAFGNQLTGAIPNEIGNLTNLVWLLLNNNLFSDTIPASLGKLTHLNQLLLSSNQLEGHIPEELANLESIRSIYLNDNKLSGCIPTSFSVLCGKDIKLHDNLCLSHNGAFRSFCINNQCQPARVVGCGSCDDGILNQDEEKIDCGGTCTSCSPCSGTFDFEALMVFYEATGGDNWNINTGWGEDCNVCSWYGIECDSTSRVMNIFLPFNNLKGEIPEELGDIENLKGLLLDFNSLTGSIPEEIGEVE